MDAKKTPLKLYRALYGDDKLEKVPKRGVKRSSNSEQIYPSEKDEQIRLATWLTKKGVLFYHVPNGGYRRKVEAYELVRCGVKAGVPDIVIPLARKGSNSLYIELKRKKGGVLSDSQKYWLDALNKAGNKAVVCYGCDEAMAVVEDYLA